MALLEVNGLRTSFFTDAGEVKAVDGMRISIIMPTFADNLQTK